MTDTVKPWPALWSLIFGFFMILVDATIVTVAIPRLATDLDTSLTAVIWVTSAYLLAYAVPLLITGRLGDRFGPRRLYLIGLTVFTASSLWCGLAGSIEMLILARVAQGLGASIMTPQTMAVITRLFPPDKRGAAMGLWGATAGVASLVGPLLGGVLVDGLGWQWIFFVNVPVGIVGFVLAIVNVPVLETHRHRFDWLGVALSAIGMFLVVFGIQEGENFGWGTIAGPISVWSLIIGGAVVLAAFVGWQAYLGRPPEPAGRRTRPRPEPLLPLVLFRDRNFALANLAVTTVGFVVSSMMLPIMLWTQNVHGFTPTQSALLLAPTAVISGVLAPVSWAAGSRCGAPAGWPPPDWGCSRSAPPSTARRSPRTRPGRGCSCPRWCSGWPTPARGARCRSPPPGTCRACWPARAPGCTTRRARWAPCSARPRSPR